MIWFARHLSLWLSMMTPVGYEDGGSANPGVASSIAAAMSDDRAGTPNLPVPAAKNPVPARKIVNNTQVELSTEDLDQVARRLKEWVTNGPVADSEWTASPGAPRRGKWTFKVPLASRDDLLEEVRKCGRLVSLKAESRDVTEEFLALDSSPIGKQAAIVRLEKFISDPAGKLDEVLTAERELSRVQGDMERMQVRRNALENLATMATVNLTAIESMPESTPAGSSFRLRTENATGGSFNLLGQVGEGILFALIWIVPWLLIALILAGVSWPYVPKYRKWKAERALKAEAAKADEAKAAAAKAEASKAEAAKAEAAKAEAAKAEAAKAEATKAEAAKVETQPGSGSMTAGQPAANSKQASKNK